VIAVSVRHHNEVELRQVDALRFRILRKNLRVVAGVEQNPFPVVFDKRSVAPVFRHRGCFTECIIENGELRFAGSCARLWSGGCCGATLNEKQECCTKGNHSVIGCHCALPFDGIVTLRGLGSPEAHYTLRNLVSQVHKRMLPSGRARDVASSISLATRRRARSFLLAIQISTDAASQTSPRAAHKIVEVSSFSGCYSDASETRRGRLTRRK
jgi:hypothetical protein